MTGPGEGAVSVVSFWQMIMSIIDMTKQIADACVRYVNSIWVEKEAAV